MIYKYCELVPGGFTIKKRKSTGTVSVIFSIAISILLLCSGPLLSSPVIIGERGLPINITQSLEYIEDRDGALTLDKVIKTDISAWKTISSNNINFGYTRSAYWFKFTLEDSRNIQSRLLLEINFPSLDYVDFYYPGSRGGYDVIKTGDRRPFTGREISDSNFIFSLNHAGDNGTYFLRIENGGSLRFRARIFSDNSFMEERNKYLPLIWFLFGLEVFSALFYFFIFLYLRDRSYLYFSFFTLSIFFDQINFRGFAFQFLWPSHPAFGNIVTLMIPGFIGLFSALFFRKILDTRSTSILFHRLLSFFALFVFPLLLGLSIILPHNVVGITRYYTMLLYGILIIPAMIHYMKRGNRFAVYFLSGFAILMIINVVSTLMVLGKIPSMPFREWIMDAGYIQIILLSSLGLVDRFKSTTDDLVESGKSIDEKNKMLILANEEMAASNEELEAMNEEFEAQNRELINSEKALIASEMEMKDIFNSSSDAFIIHDLEGNILDVNNRMLIMYGTNIGMALTMNMTDISSPDSDIAVISAYWKRVIDGDELLFEWKSLRCSDQAEFFVEVGLKKLLWRDKDVVLASIRDLTERKAIEKERELVRNQLVQSQKMEAVGTLAGGIAHDFNNVLGGILGSLNLVDVLIREENIKNSMEINEYLETAVASSLRAADMTKQLLTLSRKSELKMEPVLVQGSLKHVMNVCRNSFPKSVELDFKLDDQPLYVYADQSHIDQALLNLCLNASHSMTLMRRDEDSYGGTLKVEACIVRSDNISYSSLQGASPDISYVAIRVEDNGVGIHEDIRGRIFEPFFTTKSQDNGTGLGLAMTYSIISQHGGFITVDSEPGKGSVFTIYLPLLDQSQSFVPEIRQGLVMGTGLILVIDDEEVVLRVTAGMLKKCGYDVITAIKPDRGVELFKHEHGNISVVVLDNAMPGMSGMEVYKILKGINPSVKVILCSGFMDDISMQKARGIGITDFMSKPYAFEELSRKISEVTR